MHRTALLFLTFLPIGVAVAAPAGMLDPTFGNNGRRIVAHDAGGDMSDDGRAIVQESDGSLTLVTEASNGGNSHAIGFVRMTRDGKAIAGAPPTVFAHPDIHSLRPFAAQRLASGKLLVVGDMRKTSLYTFDGFACRFDADLTLDVEFGSVETPGCLVVERAGFSGMAEQDDGKILLAGRARINGEYRAALMRMDDDGVPDDGFGTDGIAARTLGARFSDVAQAPDGRVIAIGDTATGNEEMLLAAFEADGSADFDFSDNGGLFSIPAGDESAFGNAVDVAPDGSYVFTGMFSNVAEEGTSIAVLRLLPNGNAAPGFGFGLRLYDPCAQDALPCNARGQDVAVLPDGRIVVAGMNGSVADGASTDFFAMRLLANGDADTSFGAQHPDRPGMVSIPFQLDGPDSFDIAGTLALQGERVLLLGGVASTKGASDRDIAIVRLDDGLAIFGDGFDD